MTQQLKGLFDALKVAGVFEEATIIVHGDHGSRASVRGSEAEHPAPGGARVLYATQGATDPPTFTLFANRELPKTWLSYLERRLRDDLGLGSTPVKLRVRLRSD